ncbi:MAG TPA: aminotransferase class V-fold PLP-dependent enzyme [Gemmatimonadaceae bacterium]
MTDPLLEFRSEFPILDKTTYLVSNSLGPMPRSVPDKLAQYARDWASLGVTAWKKGWWEMPIAVGNDIAPLINADEGSVVMVPNVSFAQSVVASAMDFSGDRNTIVMSDLDFPSVRYAYQELGKRLGARIVSVPSDDGITLDQERLLNAIDERTRLVAISHVLYKSAFINDVGAICSYAHRMGAYVSLDAFHSVGIIPVDVKKSGADFVSGGVLKWLCGGPGGCFLYVAESLRDSLQPALTGWQAHSRPFAFEDRMDYAEGASRWLNGTPVIPALYAATEGAKIIQRAGIDAIRKKSVRQTSRLIELADDRGYRVFSPRDPERRGGTVTIDVPHAYEISQALIAREILVDYRVGAGIRVAPFFFTTDAEIELLVETIDEALRTEEWKRYSNNRSSVVT